MKCGELPLTLSPTPQPLLPVLSPGQHSHPEGTTTTSREDGESNGLWLSDSCKQPFSCTLSEAGLNPFSSDRGAGLAAVVTMLPVGLGKLWPHPACGGCLKVQAWRVKQMQVSSTCPGCPISQGITCCLAPCLHWELPVSLSEK